MWTRRKTNERRTKPGNKTKEWSSRIKNNVTLRVETAAMTRYEEQVNQTRPAQSARWDQFHRFPQTIEAVPGAIHRVVETTKKLLDPFQVSKVIMESIPEAVKEFAWYLVLGLASAWGIMVFVVCLYATIKIVKIGCCLMKKSIGGAKATKKFVKASCARQRRRRQETVQNIVRSDV